jgi:hypothetical protein
MTRSAWAIVIVLATASAARAQQSQLSVSAAAQIFTADQYRLAGTNRVEPDLGISWLRQSTLGGNASVDLNLTRRRDALRLGRAVLSLKDSKAFGYTWDVSAGDTGTPPFVPDFGFSNLRAPAVTFAGAAVAGHNERTTVRLAGGRTTQTRNLFGTDFVELRQTLFQADVGVQVSKRVQLTARGSRVGNGDLDPYPTYVDWSEDIGAGMVLKPSAAWQFAADAGVSRFQRRGAHNTEVSPSWLLGATMTGARGRLELNAQRFSVGRFAVANYPYNDRQGVFASGELQLGAPVRIFGGADVSRTNVDPESAANATVAMPEGLQTRGFGGVRVQVANRSLFTLRAEGGGREINPSQYSPGFESDTGAITAEWHGDVPRATLFARYERRTNVDAYYAPSSFRQHEMSTQVFFHLGKGRDLFAQGVSIRRADRDGGGETDWYSGAGFQMPVSSLFVRLEGTVGRTEAWETGRATDRRILVASVSGRIASKLFLNADVVVTNAPLGIEGSRPWFVRSMIRLTRTLTYGTALVPAVDGRLPMTGPMGSVDSVVFLDWNGNGVREENEEPATGVAVTISRVGASVTGRDGRVAFGRVPVGERLVGLDLSTVPADYDLPQEPSRLIDVERGAHARVEFGLIPVGSIAGTVFADTDGDGALGAADQPIPGAVVTIDDDSRSELARLGRFRFDNVRLGRHEVALAMDSLDDGATLVGPPRVEVELTRDGRAATVVFLVRAEKRPEIRRVFPPKKDSQGK